MSAEGEPFLWIVGSDLAVCIAVFVYNYIKHGNDKNVGPMPY